MKTALEGAAVLCSVFGLAGAQVVTFGAKDEKLGFELITTAPRTLEVRRITSADWKSHHGDINIVGETVLKVDGVSVRSMDEFDRQLRVKRQGDSDFTIEFGTRGRAAPQPLPSGLRGSSDAGANSSHVIRGSSQSPPGSGGAEPEETSIRLGSKFTPESNWRDSLFMWVVRVVVSTSIKPVVLWFNSNCGVCGAEPGFSNEPSLSFTGFKYCFIFFVVGILGFLLYQLIVLWSGKPVTHPFKENAAFGSATTVLLILAYLVALFNFGGNVEDFKKYNKEYKELKESNQNLEIDEEKLIKLKEDTLPKFGYFLNFMLGLVFKGVRFVSLTANFSQTANAIAWFFFEEIAVISATFLGAFFMAQAGLDFNPTTPQDARAHVYYLFVDGLWKCGCVAAAHILYLRFAWHHDESDMNSEWDHVPKGHDKKQGLKQALKAGGLDSADRRNDVKDKYQNAQIAEINKVFSIPGEKYLMCGGALKTRTTCDCFYNTAQNTNSADYDIYKWSPRNLWLLLLSAHIGLDVVQFGLSQSNGPIVKKCRGKSSPVPERGEDYTVPMFSPGLSFSNALDDIYFEEIVFPNFDNNSPVVEALNMQYNKFRNEGRDLKDGLRKSMNSSTAIGHFLLFGVVFVIVKCFVKYVLSPCSENTDTATRDAWSEAVSLTAPSTVLAPSSSPPS